MASRHRQRRLCMLQSHVRSSLGSWYETKKADEAEHSKVFHVVGLLFNEASRHRRAALYLVIRPWRRRQLFDPNSVVSAVQCHAVRSKSTLRPKTSPPAPRTTAQ